MVYLDYCFTLEGKFRLVLAPHPLKYLKHKATQCAGLQRKYETLKGLFIAAGKGIHLFLDSLGVIIGIQFNGD